MHREKEGERNGGLCAREKGAKIAVQRGRHAGGEGKGPSMTAVRSVLPVGCCVCVLCALSWRAHALCGRARAMGAAAGGKNQGQRKKVGGVVLLCGKKAGGNNAEARARPQPVLGVRGVRRTGCLF